MEGNFSNYSNLVIDNDIVESFVKSPADSQVVSGYHLMKLYEDNSLIYIVASSGQDDTAYTVAKIAVSQLQALMVAYQEKYDKNSFYQNLILDNMLLVDIYNRAKKLHIDPNCCRVVFLVDSSRGMNGMISELLKGMYSVQSGDFVTAVDEDRTILIKSFGSAPTNDMLAEIADTIGAYMTVCNNLVLIEDYLDILNSLTIEDAQDAAKRYLNVNNAVISVLLPSNN